MISSGKLAPGRPAPERSRPRAGRRRQRQHRPRDLRPARGRRSRRDAPRPRHLRRGRGASSTEVERIAADAVAEARRAGVAPGDVARAIYAARWAGDDAAAPERELPTSAPRRTRPPLAESCAARSLGSKPSSPRIRRAAPDSETPPAASPKGHLPDFAELSATRDELIERLADARADAERKGERQARAHARRERIIGDPEAHRWERVGQRGVRRSRLRRDPRRAALRPDRPRSSAGGGSRSRPDALSASYDAPSRPRRDPLRSRPGVPARQVSLRADREHDGPDRQDDRRRGQASLSVRRRVPLAVHLRAPALLVSDGRLDGRRLASARRAFRPRTSSRSSARSTASAASSSSPRSGSSLPS